ncbi:magnesium and cobalt transport protein CorA [Paraburkholderia sp. DHOC27]|uniref:magnesium and cobalt transport protein CorA n=1 Tax=Paraburkholderia sp. DHOC27 TaxID=2303330 RepID=UPI000E3DE1EA|nr:magnesium and cobalt transport protein CorA [Paraburkholderia sp. DHOC27]RFU49857.1 magnesium and cobalt transport protein CorA [Paraburkholderia sp. DHOC27]
MLINCAAYHDGRKLADIEVASISEYLAKPGCFVWVALKDPEVEELDAMQQQFGLHELAVEGVRIGHQPPKIEEYGESLFAVMHPLTIEDDRELLAGEISVFVGPNYVLSVRRRTDQGFREVRARCEREPDRLKDGSAFVLYALADHVVDCYFPVLEALGTEIDEIEERIFQKQSLAASRAIIESMYSLKRRLVLFQHHVQPFHEGVGKLTGGRVPKVCAGMQAYFRDLFDHLDRIVRITEARREMVVTAVQVNLGMISLAESEVTKRLGSFAALFAVPTMIAGIYGMNFQEIPELHWQFGYPAVIAVMVTIDLFLFWRFRKAGWM